MHHSHAILAICAAALLAGGTAASARTSSIPTVPGTCSYAHIKMVSTRLSADNLPVPDSGSAVVLDNGVYGVAYERVPAVDRSRRGDRVLTCLIRIPRHCPPGDARGRLYTTTNLRTQESWTLPDAQHSCGGA